MHQLTQHQLIIHLPIQLQRIHPQPIHHQLILPQPIENLPIRHQPHLILNQVIRHQLHHTQLPLCHHQCLSRWPTHLPTILSNQVDFQDKVIPTILVPFHRSQLVPCPCLSQWPHHRPTVHRQQSCFQSLQVSVAAQQLHLTLVSNLLMESKNSTFLQFECT